MKRIDLKTRPPRDLKTIQREIDLRAGLWVYRFFGYAFAIGAVVVAGSSFMPPYEPGLIVVRVFGGLFVFGGLAVLLLRSSQRTYRSRVRALRDGVMVHATVVRHSRKFVFWKSKRDYVVAVDFEHNGAHQSARIQSSNADLLEALPPGSTVTGFFDPESTQSLFLESLGYTVDGDQQTDSN